MRALLERSRVIAVVGCSADPAKPAHTVPRRMQQAGFRIIPVNPNHAGQEVLGERCYASLADVPERVDLVNVFRRPQFTPDVVRQAVEVGAPAVFLQLGIAHPESRRIAEEAGIDYVEDACVAVERAKYAVTHSPGA
ncbi:MAG TPA: CoA-binding protein [Egibacteraceae bacterium]|nr:CoA-binding protein [Egibacteraceae bacterium]